MFVTCARRRSLSWVGLSNVPWWCYRPYQLPDRDQWVRRTKFAPVICLLVTPGAPFWCGSCAVLRTCVACTANPLYTLNSMLLFTPPPVGKWHWIVCNVLIMCRSGIGKQSIGTEGAPIQLAQCWFPGLAISNAKMLIYFSNEIYGSNFIKQTRKLLWFEITKMLIAV